MRDSPLYIRTHRVLLTLRISPSTFPARPCRIVYLSIASTMYWQNVSSSFSAQKPGRTKTSITSGSRSLDCFWRRESAVIFRTKRRSLVCWGVYVYIYACMLILLCGWVCMRSCGTDIEILFCKYASIYVFIHFYSKRAFSITHVLTYTYTHTRTQVRVFITEGEGSHLFGWLHLAHASPPEEHLLLNRFLSRVRRRISVLWEVQEGWYWGMYACMCVCA